MEKTARYLFITLFSIIILLAALIFACSFMDIFRIEKIRIVNNDMIEDAYYIEKLSGIKGENGFRALFRDMDSLENLLLVFVLRDGKAEKQLLAGNPYLKKVRVGFFPPDTLRIETAERRESYMLRFLEKEIILSDDLVVLGERMSDVLPELKGLSITSYEKGHAINISESIRKALDEILGNSVYMGRSVMDKISVIDFAGELAITLQNGTRVEFGGFDDLAYKMKCLNEIYHEYLYRYNGGKLDLTDKDRKIYCPG